MVLAVLERFIQNSRGSRKTSSWVTVHTIQAIGIPNINNHAICVLKAIPYKSQNGQIVLVITQYKIFTAKALCRQFLCFDVAFSY